MIPSSIITTIEWLAQNCYIDTSSLTSTGDFFCYCDICRHHKAESSKRYCYTNKGKNRQIITICIECLRRYQQERYHLFGKPTGVIAVSLKSRVECLIMCALRLALMNKRKTKKNRSSGNNNSSSISVSTATTITDDDVHPNPEYDNYNIFYSAVANAFDHSETIREYFHNNRSRTQSDNKSLWPLRYQAYKEYGV
jgi:hypothetical protein